MKRNKKRAPIFAGLAILAAFFFAACQGLMSPQPADPVPDDPSFAQDIQPIFTGYCTSVSCHGAAAQARMTLVEGRSYANLVDVTSSEVPSRKRILSFDASNSCLVMKIEGRQTAGARMPAAKDRLPADQIQTIKNWINRGARNN